MTALYSPAWNNANAQQIVNERPRYLVDMGKVAQPMRLQAFTNQGWCTLYPPGCRPPNDWPYLFRSRAEADRYLAAVGLTGTFRLMGYYLEVWYATFSR